jgi:serine/threonine protein kinase
MAQSKDAARSSALRRILALSAESLSSGVGSEIATQSLRAMPPVPELNDWASFSTFLRPIPFTNISERNVSYFDDGEPKCGASFIVRPLVPDADGSLGTLEIPIGKTLVLKSVKLPRKEIQMAMETGDLSNKAQQNLQHVCMEISALSHPPLAAHPNIIKLLGFTQFPPNQTTFPSLIMERAEYGSLDNFVGSSVFQRNNEVHQNRICADIADGLYAIHECEIIHGDMKPANVLICRHETTGFVAKIGDFGYSVVPAEGFPHRNFGTDRWEAPELQEASGNKMSKESDLYSFGLVAWYLFLKGHDPFDGIDTEKVLYMKIKGDVVEKAYKDCEDGIRRSILVACLDKMANNRDCTILSNVRRKLKQEGFESQVSDQGLRFSPTFLISNFVDWTPRSRWVHYTVSLTCPFFRRFSS